MAGRVIDWEREVNRPADEISIPKLKRKSQKRYEIERQSPKKTQVETIAVSKNKIIHHLIED